MHRSFLRPARLFTLSVTLLASLLLALPAAAEENPAAAAEEERETEHLPTPYTAEQIRDSFQPGLHLVTRFTTPQGTVKRLTTVSDWSEEGVALEDVALDSEGHPTGDVSLVQATWEELRQHAQFAATEATRRRAKQRTALGELEGWLYVHHSKEGVTSTFFFPDEYPGSPVVFTREQNGFMGFKAEQIERQIVTQD